VSELVDRDPQLIWQALLVWIDTAVGFAGGSPAGAGETVALVFVAKDGQQLGPEEVTRAQLLAGRLFGARINDDQALFLALLRAPRTSQECAEVCQEVLLSAASVIRARQAGRPGWFVHGKGVLR
jgi:hypothetical protein